ncbi:MAG TPA: hypothetical protein VFQ38_02085 [Longimicrobiales bacterium]|nr:hypothetical protein [Longimicrobiales bacterium]
MPLAIRHRDDPAPELTPLPGLVVRPEPDARAMAALQRRSEADMLRRFAAGHHASGAGIRRAGFVAVAELSFDVAGRPALRDIVGGGIALAARVLGLPETNAALRPCWRCARTTAPAEASCARGACSCDYQRPEAGCAA